MKQNQNDEFDLLELFETLWRKKYTLFFITFVSFIIGIYFTINTPIRFQVSTPLQYGKQSLFIKYISINEVLKENESLFHGENLENYSVNPKSIFDKFIIEFQDYEEMVVVLRKNKFVNELIKDLGEDDKKKQLNSLAKSFTISEDRAKNVNLSFTWHNEREGKLLFKEALILTLENIKETLIKEVNLLSTSMINKNKRIILTLNDQIDLFENSLKLQVKKRMQFLNEHYILAKEMNIKTNLLPLNSNVKGDTVQVMPSTLKALKNALNYDDVYFSAYDNNYNNLPYYLRGYKTIEKEIEIIKSRTKEERLLISSGYVTLQNKLLLLKKNRSSNELKLIAEDIKKDNPSKWVNFNFDLADSSSINNRNIYLILSVIFGLILGSVYVLISTSISKRKNLLTTN